jgi:hypothetical protein
MRSFMAAVVFVVGLVAGSCAEPEEEDLGTFPCGDEECDVRSEYCAIADSCDGSEGTRTCHPVPDACEGTATIGCLSQGGNGCGELEGGGIACSPSRG